MGSLFADISMQPTIPAAKDDCKGRVYRYRKNHYVNSNGSIVWNEEFYLLKRQSCPGCEKCGWLVDSMLEGTEIIYPKDPVHGKLYALQITNEWSSWEAPLSSKIMICN